MALVEFNRYIERNGMQTKKYQTEGVEWCVDIEVNGKQMGNVRVHSGILADDMGLGKTAQMIGLILSRFVRRTLIVLPRTLLEQWVTILQKTLGHEPLVYHGTLAHKIPTEQLSNSPIVITTYGMLSQLRCKGTRCKGTRCKPKKGEPLIFGNLHSIEWDRVIFDEAHHLRNRNTLNNKAAIALKSSCKWLVTGTPIQNRITDFYGLCAVIGIEHVFYVHMENIHSITKELILKRTKEGVGIELPPLNKHIVDVQWEAEEERQLAEDIHAHLEFSKAIVREENPFRSVGFHHFAILQRARQACIDMGMLEKAIKEMVALGLIDETFLTDAVKYQSKTNKVINTILERKDNGRAKLVFCHYHKEIDTVAKRLTDAGLNVARFDGRTGRTVRDKLLTDTSIDALVLQIKTGCEGLNLQQFSEVYFISPNWNPAIEDQAVARCHRLGQLCDTDVFSFRMVAFDDERFTRSMDMYTRDLQHLKRINMKSIYQNPDSTGDKLPEPCAICLDDQHTNTSYKLECGHHFHSTCITKWFKCNATCPMCRKND